MGGAPAKGAIESVEDLSPLIDREACRSRAPVGRWSGPSVRGSPVGGIGTGFGPRAIRLRTDGPAAVSSRGPLCVRLASTAPGRRSRTGIWPPASHLRRHMHSIRHGPGAHRSCETPWRGACTGGLRRRGPFWAGVVLSVLVRSAVRNTAEPWIWLGPSEVARPGVRNAEWGDAPDGVGSIFSINHARHPCAATLPPTHADQISAGQEDQEGRRIGR